MTFIKGQSGNPLGRPRKGNSMAEAVRNRFTPRKRDDVIDALIAIARDPSLSPETRIRAFESLVKAGWANELRGLVAVASEGEGPTKMIVTWGGDGA